MRTRRGRRTYYRRPHRHGALCRYERRLMRKVDRVIVRLAQLGALVLLAGGAALVVAVAR